MRTREGWDLLKREEGDENYGKGEGEMGSIKCGGRVGMRIINGGGKEKGGMGSIEWKGGSKL